MRSSSVETAATLPFSRSSSCVYSKDFIRNLQIFKSFFHCLNVHFYIEKFSWNQRPGNRPAHRLAECNTFSNLLTENERHNVKWWPLEAERVGRPLVFGESWRPVVCWALLQNWASFLANWAIKHVQPETVDQENSFLKKKIKISMANQWKFVTFPAAPTQKWVHYFQEKWFTIGLSFSFELFLFASEGRGGAGK